MAYVIIGVIVILVVFWIVTPLFLTNRAALAAAAAPIADLRRDEMGELRDTLLRNLKDLEFDRSMGKINEDEYGVLRGELTAQISQVLDRLEGASRGYSVPAGGSSVLIQVPANAAEASLELEVLVARQRRRRGSARS